MDGKILLKARKTLNLSQEDMARKLYISYQTYNGYENGKKIPTTKFERINEVIKEAEAWRDNMPVISEQESSDILKEIQKELRAIRRENKEIKNLISQVLEDNDAESKINHLSSKQFDLLKQVLQNLSGGVKELKKADLKSANTKQGINNG